MPSLNELADLAAEQLRERGQHKGDIAAAAAAAAAKAAAREAEEARARAMQGGCADGRAAMRDQHRAQRKHRQQQESAFTERWQLDDAGDAADLYVQRHETGEWRWGYDGQWHWHAYGEQPPGGAWSAQQPGPPAVNDGGGEEQPDGPPGVDAPTFAPADDAALRGGAASAAAGLPSTMGAARAGEAARPPPEPPPPKQPTSEAAPGQQPNAPPSSASGRAAGAGQGGGPSKGVPPAAAAAQGPALAAAPFALAAFSEALAASRTFRSPHCDTAMAEVRRSAELCGFSMASAPRLTPAGGPQEALLRSPAGPFVHTSRWAGRSPCVPSGSRPGGGPGGPVRVLPGPRALGAAAGGAARAAARRHQRLVGHGGGQAGRGGRQAGCAEAAPLCHRPAAAPPPTRTSAPPHRLCHAPRSPVHEAHGYSCRPTCTCPGPPFHRLPPRPVTAAARRLRGRAQRLRPRAGAAPGLRGGTRGSRRGLRQPAALRGGRGGPD